MRTKLTNEYFINIGLGDNALFVVIELAYQTINIISSEICGKDECVSNKFHDKCEMKFFRIMLLTPWQLKQLPLSVSTAVSESTKSHLGM